MMVAWQWNEPNGMGPWCDPSREDCGRRNNWGNNNLTTSRYLAWYKAVSDAVVGVDSQLTVGGPASSGPRSPQCVYSILYRF